MQKSIKALLFTVIFTLLFTTAALADGENAYTTADILNVRSNPAMTAPVIDQYPYGTPVQVTNSSDIWYQIRYQNGYAYVHSDYVKFNQDLPDVQAVASSQGQKIVEIAKQYIGTPYVYGGMSPAGFDCSGFVKYVYSQMGVSLNRVAADQSYNGYAVSRDALQPGDIICFADSNGSGYIGHVGIYVGNNQFIHSPRTGYTVTIEDMNGSYGNRFACARRIF